MPIRFDKDRLVWICLESDKDKPDELRPEFAFRPLSAREHDQWSNDLLELWKQDDSVSRVAEYLAAKIVKVRNFEMELTAGGLLDALTINEVAELALYAPMRMSLTESDKKKFASQSQSDQAASAQPAVAESAAKITHGSPH